MATRVKFSVPEREIEHSGVTFVREVDGLRHGALTVRQNHLDWKPADGKFFYRVSWDSFKRFAEAEGRHTRPRATLVRARKKLLVRAQNA